MKDLGTIPFQCQGSLASKFSLSSPGLLRFTAEKPEQIFLLHFYRLLKHGSNANFIDVLRINSQVL